MISDVEHFHVLIICLCIFVKKCLFQSFGHFFQSVVYLFAYELSAFWILIFSSRRFANIFYSFWVVFFLTILFSVMRININETVLSYMYLSGLSQIYYLKSTGGPQSFCSSGDGKYLSPLAERRAQRAC